MLHGQGVPVMVPIDHEAAIKAVSLNSKLREPLYRALGIDVDKLKKTISAQISRGIAAGRTYDEIANFINLTTAAPLNRAKTIVRTQGHRIQETGAEDARQAAKAKGADIVKQWDATLDGATRKTHRQLDGQIRETNEPFEVNGKKAMFPGGFGDPAEDCNCRCCALTRARKALDAEELEIMVERARTFGMQEDKKQTFQNFKERYIPASKLIEKYGESGIISVGDLILPVQKFIGYSLNPIKTLDKAKAFRKALGYTLSNADELVDNIIEHIGEYQFVQNGVTEYGMKYECILELTGPNGKTAKVLTGWIEKDSKKHLTSVYITDKKVKR